jgi:uncharacterized protein (TIGR02246 family)
MAALPEGSRSGSVERRNDLKEARQKSSMTGTWMASFWLTGMLVAGVSASAAPDEIGSVSSVGAGIARALSAGDTSKLGDFYMDDALLLPPHENPLRGRAAVVAYFQNLLKAGRVSLEIRSGTAHRDGDLAYDAGQFSLQLAPADGSMTRDVGKYLAVLKRGTDGRWRIAVDAWNSDLAIR